MWFSNRCVDSVRNMFPDAIILREIKRRNKQSDQTKKHKIKKHIFKGTPIAEIWKKHGIRTVTDMKDVHTTNNIAYFNYRCRYVNKVMQNKAKRPNTVVNVEVSIFGKVWPYIARSFTKTKQVSKHIPIIYIQ